MGVQPLRRTNSICKDSKAQKTMAPSACGKLFKITGEQGANEVLGETPSWDEGKMQGRKGLTNWDSFCRSRRATEVCDQ